MEDAAIKYGNENLLNSVLSELKHRIKAPPPTVIVEEHKVNNPPPQDIKSKVTPPEVPSQESKPKTQHKKSNYEAQDTATASPNDINGIAEYSAYCKSVGAPLNGQSDQSQTLPSLNRIPPTEVINQRPKPSTPPVKPTRRNKPPNTAPVSKIPVPITGVNETRISSELHQLIESAFASPNRTKGRTISVASDIIENDNRKATMLTSDHKRSLASVDSGLDGIALKSPSIYDNDDCFYSVGNVDDELDRDGVRRESRGNTSVNSGRSYDWRRSQQSLGENLEVDNISLNSVDDTDDSKLNGKLLKAKAKQLKKQATAQRERVGAFIDAATSNASVRIKKLRRPSLKFKGKGKRMQNLANKIGSNKAFEDNNSSLPTSCLRSDSENDVSEKKISSIPRNNSLPTSLDDGVDLLNEHKVPIKSGYLKKQGGKIKTWHERWFILIGDHLNYYKDVDGKYLSTIFLSGARVISYPPRNNSNDTHKYLFEIFPENNRPKMNSNHESYVLSASSQTDMDEWVKAIRRVILSPFGGGIFGQRLDETLKHDRRLKSSVGSAKSSGSLDRSLPCDIPLIVQNCIEFIRKRLNEEGLFRLPGQTNEVKDFQEAYDMGERPVFPRSTDVHTVSSLLKGYLRELPEPVIPFGRYEPLIAAAKMSQNNQKSPKATSEIEMSKESEVAQNMIKKQINLLPKPNFDLLKYLCSFLDEVQSHSNTNKMDIFNLSMVFGPNIMRSKVDDAVTMMSDTNLVQHVMYQLIESHDYYFADDCNVDVDSGGLLPGVGDDMNVTVDAGIGTLTTTASPLGTLGQRHATDDSGTGSLAPTPENTNKRSPPVPNAPPPTRKPAKPAKPNKPSRLRGLSGSLDANEVYTSSPTDDNHRKSYYDNVTSVASGTKPGNDLLYEEVNNDDWLRSNDASEFCDQSQASTEQASYYINNRSTPSTQSPHSSTRAVIGSDGRPESCRASTGENLSDLRSRVPPRVVRRQKLVRRSRPNNSDEESNTESVAIDERAFSSVSSHRSSYQNDVKSRGGAIPDNPRTASCPLLKYTLNGHLGGKEGKRFSAGSGSDGGSSASSAPIAPARNHRKSRKDEANPVHPRDSGSVAPPGSTRSSNITSLGTSVSSRPLTYKEMEEQLLSLKEELNKQRLEHEKRSRMLEEHYIIKIRGSTSSGPLHSPDQYTSPGFPPQHQPLISSMRESNIPLSPTESCGFRGFDDPPGEPQELNLYRTSSGVSRTYSIESQAEMRYREELKRHAITKIRLRNAERGLRQAEERNNQLQREMENFFETFSSMLPQCAP